MTLLTVDRYRVLTKDLDSTSEDVTAALAGAQSIVETYLNRYIESAERTETLTVYPGGRVYPSAVPVTVVDASDYEISSDGWAIIGATPAFPDAWDTPAYVGRTVSVTYTGGWTTSDVPYAIELGIARAAQGLISLSGSEYIDPSIRSLSVEGYSVTYGRSETSGTTGDQYADLLLKPYRKRRVA